MAATLVGTDGTCVTTAVVGSGTALTLAKPSALANDHTMVAVVNSSVTGATWNVPTGWVQVASHTLGRGFFAFTRYVHTASTETATSYSFTASNTGRVIGAIFLATGVSNSSPADGVANSTTTSSTTGLQVPSLTPTVAQDLLVYAAISYHSSGPLTYTPPSGLTEIVDLSTAVSGSVSNLEVATLALPTPAAATGTQTATISATASGGQTAFTFALRAGGYTAPSATLTSMAVGAVTPTGFKVSAATANVATNARLAVSTSIAMTTPSFSTTAVPDADGYVTLTSPTLVANTQYYYQVELDGVLQTSMQGQARSLPTAGTANFSFAAASCAKSYSNDAIIWDDIRTRVGANATKAAFFMHLGDMHYDDLGDNGRATLNDNLQSYHSVFSQAKQQLLYREIPLVYTASDHDAGGSNIWSNSPNLPFYQAAYRKVFPHYPLVPDINGDGAGTYQSWGVGRVLFISTDGRSYMSDIAATDDASKTKLGATQKAWLKTQLARTDYPVKVWFHEDAWNNRSTFTLDDTWGAFTTERAEIGNYIVANGVDVMYVHGDFHVLAAETGLNNTWGGFPLISSSPLDQTTFIGNGLWSNGFYPNPVSSSTLTQQYGWFDVEDTGSKIKITFTGYGKDASGSVMEPKISMVNTFSAVKTTTMTLGASVTGGRFASVNVVSSAPIFSANEFGRKAANATPTALLSLSSTATGAKAAVFALKTTVLALAKSLAGSKRFATTRSAAIAFALTGSGGRTLIRTGSVTTLLGLQTIPTAFKIPAPVTVISHLALDANTLSVAYLYSLQGYGIDGAIDQSASWAAVMARMRAAEPVGDDVESLKSWHGLVELGQLPGQFLWKLASAEESLAPAAWSVLAATGGLGVLPPAGHDAPSVTTVTVAGDKTGGRFNASVHFYVNDQQVVFWECWPEQSADQITWSPVAPNPISGWIDETTRWDTGWASSWSAPIPYPTTYFRCRMRVRNRSFGGWTYSNIRTINR